jgi:hypothetical protein
MDRSLEVVNLIKISTKNKSSLTSLRDRRTSSLATSLSSDSSLISISEPYSSEDWELPPKKPQNVYKLKLWNYISHYFIEFHLVNIPFTFDQDPIHINHLDKSLIDWDKKQGYLHVHFGDIKFGLNPLVRPYLPVSSLCCVTNICHKQFFNTFIGGF